MNRQGQIPRSRGGICGVILILLGLWGGLAPFVGPYFHFGFTPDATWHYDSGRLYYSIIPGGAALVGGVLVILTRNRGVGIAGGLLGTLGGAWFVAGSGFVTYVLKKSISPGITIVPAGAQPLRSYLETISLFSGLGILLLVAGAIAIGRFSMVGAKDVAMAAGTEFRRAFVRPDHQARSRRLFQSQASCRSLARDPGPGEFVTRKRQSDRGGLA